MILSELKDPEHVDEHIHCIREEGDCLTNKCENEIDKLKKELEKYKHALREEVEKRSKAEDMLKAVQTINQVRSIKDNSEVCEQCEFSCIAKKDLDAHVSVTHKKEKCDKCNKQYSSSAQIKRHMWRSHEPVECNNCEKLIPNRYDLKRHEREDHKITKLQE